MLTLLELAKKGVTRLKIRVSLVRFRPWAPPKFHLSNSLAVSQGGAEPPKNGSRYTLARPLAAKWGPANPDLPYWKPSTSTSSASGAGISTCTIHVSSGETVGAIALVIPSRLRSRVVSPEERSLKSRAKLPRYP